MMTVIVDDDPKADRKRRIGAWYPCLSLDRDDDHDDSAAIQEWVWPMVTIEYVWFLFSFLGGDAEGT